MLDHEVATDVLRLTVVGFAFLSILSWPGLAATIGLTCVSEKSLDVKRRIASPASGQFSAHIELFGEHVVGITVSKAHWCSPSGAFVTDREIGFACGLNLAGQRISYSFTFERLHGTFEQRIFVIGRLRQVNYGVCRLETLSRPRARS